MDIKFAYKIQDEQDFDLCLKLIEHSKSIYVKQMKYYKLHKLKIFKSHFIFEDNMLINIFTSHDFYDKEFPIYNKEQFLEKCVELLNNNIF